MQKKYANKRIAFSISKRYSEVEKVLEHLPDKSKSRYICEAILEKAHCSVSSNIDEEPIRELVEKIIEEYISSGKLAVPSGEQQINVKKPGPEDDSDFTPKVYNSALSKEDEDALIDAMGAWD